MIAINNFQKGQSASSYTTDGAFAKSCNLDVFSQLGIAKINYLPTGYSTNLVGLPIDFANNTDSNHRYMYFSDDQENVYRFDTTTPAISVFGSGKGNNIEYYDHRLYAIYRNTINYYDFGTSSWNILTSAFSNLNVKDNHFMYYYKGDGLLYIAGAYNVGFKISTIDSSGAFTQSAFSMPIDYKPISLTGAGDYLLI